jgi:hypothetical protein
MYRTSWCKVSYSSHSSANRVTQQTATHARTHDSDLACTTDCILFASEVRKFGHVVLAEMVCCGLTAPSARRFDAILPPPTETDDLSQHLPTADCYWLRSSLSCVVCMRYVGGCCSPLTMFLPRGSVDECAYSEIAARSYEQEDKELGTAMAVDRWR